MEGLAELLKGSLVSALEDVIKAGPGVAAEDGAVVLSVDAEPRVEVRGRILAVELELDSRPNRLLKVGDRVAVEIDDVSSTGRLLTVHKAVEAFLKAAPDGGVLALDHPDVVEPALYDAGHVGLGVHEVLLRGVMGEELCESGVVAILLPDIKEVVKVADVLAGDIRPVTHHKAGDLLTGAPFLETGLLFVDGEVLPGDDLSELSHELAALLVDIMGTGEGDIVSVAAVAYLEAAGKARELPVEIVADYVRQNRRAGRTLGEYVSVLGLRDIKAVTRSLALLGVDLLPDAADAGNGAGESLGEVERTGLQGSPDAGLGDAREEVLQVGVEDVVLPKMALSVVNDGLPLHESGHAVRGLIEGLKDPVKVSLEGLEDPDRSGDSTDAAGLLRNGEGPVAVDIALGIKEVIELRHRKRMTLLSQLVHLDSVQEDKEVLGVLHLGRRFYNRFSFHEVGFIKGQDIPEVVFFVYEREFENIESTFYIP